MQTETLTAPKQVALEEFNTGNDDVKSLLHRLFGKEAFERADIVDRITSFADVCEAEGTTEEEFFRVCAAAGLSPDEIAYRQMKMIARVLNEGWVPDYDDRNQQKWELWFYLNEPGFRLDVAHCDYSFSGVGARLVFREKRLAEHATRIFLPVYKAFSTI